MVNTTLLCNLRLKVFVENIGKPGGWMLRIYLCVCVFGSTLAGSFGKWKRDDSKIFSYTSPA